MYVLVDLNRSPPLLELREAENLRALKVVVRCQTRDREHLAGALAPVGALDDSCDAVLHIDELRRLAGRLADDTAWQEGFKAMVDYARSKGWGIGPGGLQAHCEWTDVV